MQARAEIKCSMVERLPTAQPPPSCSLHMQSNPQVLRPKAVSSRGPLGILGK